MMNDLDLSFGIIGRRVNRRDRGRGLVQNEKGSITVFRTPAANALCDGHRALSGNVGRNSNGDGYAGGRERVSAR